MTEPMTPLSKLERFRRTESRIRYARAVASTVHRFYELGQRVANDFPDDFTDEQKVAWFSACQRISDAVNDEFGYEGDQR